MLKYIVIATALLVIASARNPVDNQQSNNQQANNQQSNNQQSNNQQSNNQQSNNRPSDNRPSVTAIECPTNYKEFLLIAHESDCNKFYSCSNGVKYLFECPSGTAFDDQRQVCDYIENVTCTNNKQVTPQELSAVESRMSNNQQSNNQQSNNQQSNNQQSNNQQSNNQQSNNQQSNNQQSNNQQSNNPQSNNQQSNNQQSNNQQSNNQQSNNRPSDNRPSVTVIECPTNYKEFLLIAHESDCNKFYSCSNGVKYLFECPSGTAFDDQRQVCDYIENVKCTNNKQVTPQELSAVESRMSNNQQSNNQQSNNQQSNNQQSNNQQSNNPQSNNQQSNNNQSKNQQSNNQQSNNQQSNNQQSNNQQSNNRPSDNRPSVTVIECPTNYKEFLLIAHESDCNKFYSCSNGVKYLFECPSGTAFDDQRQVCDHIENVKCTNNKQVTPQELSAAESRMSGFIRSWDLAKALGECPRDWTVFQLVAHETECNKFYSCSNGIKYEFECPTGTSFDVVAQTCDHTENVKCHQKECPSDWSQFQLLAHESDCTKFYSCSNGEKVEFRCPAGTAFDFDEQTCDWKSNVRCASRIQPSSRL